MKALLIVTDLYKTIGGGQTVYKSIIEATPNVQFYYFVKDEVASAVRPKNAYPITLSSRRSLKVLASPSYSIYELSALESADQFARSVAGRAFDLVDIPDYYTFGSALKHAFFHHKVKIGRTILAMHGNISKSKELNWGRSDSNIHEDILLELAQFNEADDVYAISTQYMREWQSKIDRAIQYIDPAHFVSTAPIDIADDSSKPSIYCVGRSERRKGNDLFIELVRWLRRDSFETAAHIGDQDFSCKGTSSSCFLDNIAKQRDIEIKSIPAMDRNELQSLYARRSIVVLPVRYDTLNLVALEALFSGCPVVISSRAGVCEYLDSTHPGLPYIKIDFNNFYGSVGIIQDLIDHYDEHRQKLKEYLLANSTKPLRPLNIEFIYEKFILKPKIFKNIKNDIIKYEECVFSYKKYVYEIAHYLIPNKLHILFRYNIHDLKRFIVDKIIKSKYSGDAKFIYAIKEAMSIPSKTKIITDYPEYNIQDLQKKLNIIYDSATSPFCRCNFWFDIARIERILGNELNAVVYEIRLLRLLGSDIFGLLPQVISTLEKLGFSYEAKAAHAMFADPYLAEDNIYHFLKEAHERNFVRNEKDLEKYDDRRISVNTKVSVIVSLYNAADKLKFFLSALSQQTLIKRGEVEIILIDSGSPTNECQVFYDFMNENPLNVVYARSAERETIQAAWNRGIGLTSSPYLVFLGVDEALYPESLEILADELDKRSDIDWVMANSLVTAVEENGVYMHDIMQYNRSGAIKDNTYLETCYLSYVGGMYRKSLHERYGYYDEKFSAAGDTEFKNRVLPHINVKFIPKQLGLFLNYPDGQTTQSPKAEIEDLRAWYIHRSPGGIRYAFENRPVEDVEKLLCLSLGYRKSYCVHLSCDIEYADFLAHYIVKRTPESMIAHSTIHGLDEMLTQLRGLELTSSLPSRTGGISRLLKAWRTASRYEATHRKVLKLMSRPCYSIFNDNRYEQHYWLWKSH